MKCYLVPDMKKPETDRELVDFIVDTLGNGEEHYILGSWETFVKKRKQRRRLILWFSTTGFAASVLIGWLGFKFIAADSVIHNFYSELKQQIPNNQAIAVKKDTTGQNYLTLIDTLLLSESNNAMQQNNVISFNRHDDSKFKNQTKNNTRLDTKENNEYKIIASIHPADSHKTDLTSDSINTAFPLNSGINETGKTIAANQKSDSSAVIPSVRLTVTEIKHDDYSDIQNNAAVKKIRFGVCFSPGVTSTATVSSFNYSGGLSADFGLSRHFGLSTGLLVERQNVINKATDNPSWMPAGQAEAVLVGIDLPVNITWKFLVRKSMCYYVSSGISSIAYLSEKYITTSYSQKIVGVINMVGGERTVDYQLENVESTEQRKEVPLNSFDFAGRVNIIFGLEQHLSSKIYLHVEPYVKIPVYGLATRDLKYTISGVTCKISF